jgi:dihydroorotate dehydrogenase
MRVREKRLCAHSKAAAMPVTAMGLAFANRLGLAAGFDRTGELLPSLRAVVFGHVEVGTITPSSGHAGALGRSDFRLRIGANIGSARPGLDEGVIEDYTRTMKQVFGLCDYMVANLSAPALRRDGDTPGVETLVKRLSVTRDVVSAVRGRRLPLLLKLEAGLNGKSFPAAIMATRVYGLDGIVLVSDCLDRIRAIAAYLGGLSIISVGGVRSADDVRARVAAGAALVQIHSAYANGGAARIRRILKELSPPSEPSFA